MSTFQWKRRTKRKKSILHLQPSAANGDMEWTIKNTAKQFKSTHWSGLKCLSTKCHCALATSLCLILFNYAHKNMTLAIVRSRWVFLRICCEIRHKYVKKAANNWFTLNPSRYLQSPSNRQCRCCRFDPRLNPRLEPLLDLRWMVNVSFPVDCRTRHIDHMFRIIAKNSPTSGILVFGGKVHNFLYGWNGIACQKKRLKLFIINKISIEMPKYKSPSPKMFSNCTKRWSNAPSF